ncbi:MAG TPA: hypothetical protein VK620_05250 [Bradyrhizobium sp.]|nr:hypothetical protein [Bradyrhizobium sp.]
MMIVIVTRDDLRDEFLMADDAFALSPISARATQPSEQDYDAIREAFMETARGRWFLGEYAKRNRNADTRMVLDAVARVEENLAAQRQAAPDNGLAEALVAISSAVDEARAAASVAIDDLALEETLAPVRKGARVIREIAWRWREIGTDGRICDLIDSQADAIEAGCGQIASINPLAALTAAFDLIEKEIAAFGDGTAAFPPAAEEAVPSSSSAPSPSDEMPASELETAPTAAATSNSDTAISTQAMPDETVGAAHEIAETTAQAADAQAADAHDEAVLDMVALEMAAVDPFDIDDPSDIDQIEVAELPPEAPVVVAREPEPPAPPAIAPSLQPSLQPSFQPSPQASAQASREASPEPSHEPSLGSALIANGILRKPTASGPDPLAPIRRLSQAEKIAFFS